MELGLSDSVAEDYSIGVWDHFYNNSDLDQNISTRYVNVSHYAEFKSKPQITLDDQHVEFKWFDLSVEFNDEKYHSYTRNYEFWLLDRMQNTHD